MTPRPFFNAPPRSIFEVPPGTPGDPAPWSLPGSPRKRTDEKGATS